MTTRIRISLLAAATAVLLALPAADASAASCAKSGFKTLDQSKYIVFQKGPKPKGDATSDFGYYACRIKNAKRYTLGGNECFGNDLGRTGDYSLAGNFIAYEAYTCGDPEGEADAKTINVATGARKSYQAEQGEIPGGGVQDRSITDIQVNSKGNLAWIALVRQVISGDARRFDVRRVIDGIVDRVDFGQDVLADSLAYSGGNIFWMNSGVAKTAPLPTN
ncbi:MAG TPA: hypothetical protein VF715_08960 [Thermoleophilaceae bacterium]